MTSGEPRSQGGNAAARGLVAFNSVVSRIQCYLATIAAIIFVALTLIEIVARYFFNYSQLWVPEIATSMFIWSVFLAAAICFRSGSHLVVDIVSFREGSVVNAVHRFAIFAFSLIFALAFAYFGYLLLKSGFNRRTPVLGIPLFYNYLAPWIMGLTSLPFIVEHYVRPGHVEERLTPPSAV